MNTKTKLLSLLLALCIVLSPAPSALAANGTLEGDGTADSPYLIADAADLAAFRDMVNAEASSAKCAKLTADIELCGEWTPFSPASGYVTEAYAGTFDGDFHTISGLYINSSSSNQGLFGAINGAEIKNLKVEGSVTSSNNYVGGIVGKIQQGTVTNCSFSGSAETTKSGGYAGGIAGYAGNTTAQTAVISGCSNSAAVTGETRGTVGGIIGYAKYTTITDCYNTGTITGTTRSGGIAGQLQNNCTASNCYNTGAATSDICDFLYLSSTLTNCYYNEKAANDENGTVTDCGQIADTSTLLENLGSAFVADTDNINGGYPILSWQKGEEPVPKNPSISISGGSVLYMQNSGAAPQTTLSVSYTDMDAAPVEWSADSDIILLEPPTDNDDNDSKIIVKAVKAGKATVTAKVQDSDLTAELVITVYPFITTVEIDGDVTVGETVTAKVNVLGGEYDYENYPELKFQWKYLSQEDYLAGNTSSSSYRDISGAVNRELTITEDLKGDYLSFSFLYNGEDKTPSRPIEVKQYIPPTPSPEPTPTPYIEPTVSPQDILQAARDALGDYYKITPIFGTDTNIIDILKADFAQNGVDCSEFDIALTSVETVYGGADIAENGDITYFYADPNTTPSIKMGSFNASFTLSIDDAEVTLDVPVIVYWDQDRVKDTMKSEILDNVTLEGILGENTAADRITDNLILPKVIDDKKWSLISWQSSDSDVISISTENQTTTDTLFNPYIGKVKRGAEDKTVTLTAIFSFQLTNDMTGSETPVTMSKVFDVTVKAVGTEQIEAIQKDLNEKLDAGFNKSGISDAVSGEALALENGQYTVYNDILFPTTRDFGIDGKYYPVKLTSSNDEVIKTPDVNNAARCAVYRPAVSNADADAEVTLTITDTNSNVSVSRTFNITVPALTREEIDSEKALMQKVKSSYFDGIKGENSKADNIIKNLSPFQEVYEENGSLVWVRNISDRVNRGIVPVAMDGWEELEAWRLFRSSNPAAVTHENLLVTMQKNGKAVTISSALSSETLGKYGELYKSDPAEYADYAELADLYYQEVSADLVIRGKSTPMQLYSVAVEEKIKVSFRLQSSDSTLISDITYTNLDEGTTVYDIFKRALAENGYTYKNRGSYVYSITTPDGTTYEEMQAGENSGWIYKVNGILPDVYMGGYGLKDGDEIAVFFISDYLEGKDNKKHSSGSSIKTTATPSPTDEPVIEPMETAAPEPEKHNAYIVGYDDTTFKPDNNISRAEAAAILARITDSFDENTNYISAFPDVMSGVWYERYIAFEESKNVITGYPDGEFKPENNITRAEFAAVIAKFAELNETDTDMPFADISGHWAIEPIKSCYDKGYILGYEDNTFNPDKYITRAEAVAIINRVTGRDDIKNFTIPFIDVTENHWAYADIMEAAITHNTEDFH